MTGLVEIGTGEAAHGQLHARLDAAAGVAGDGPDALLRSGVVHPDARPRGSETRVVAAIGDEARAAGASTLWLSREDAALFFARSGSAPADRSDDPPAIAASVHLQGLCPAFAKLMRKPLGGATP